MKTKTSLLTCASLATLLCAAGGDSALAQGVDHCDHDTDSDVRVRIGLRIAPVPLSTHGRNLELVGLGSYLVNAIGGCNDCHTHPSYLPGGDPFQGEATVINTSQYLTGGRQFGPFTSPNLTPDAYGRPAGLTYEEFAHTLRTGRDPADPGRVLQVMPWPILRNLSDQDLRAIYEFLRAIPSLPDNPSPGP
jgi:hypothetical protein